MAHIPAMLTIGLSGLWMVLEVILLNAVSMSLSAISARALPGISRISSMREVGMLCGDLRLWHTSTSSLLITQS